MKKILIILGIALIASCKKDETPIATNAVLAPEKYNSGVFFRVEKSATIENMDSVRISIFGKTSYEYRGTIFKFNSLDCEGDGLRLLLDTGECAVRADYYGTTFKMLISKFTIKDNKCKTVVVSPK